MILFSINLNLKNVHVVFMYRLQITILSVIVTDSVGDELSAHPHPHHRAQRPQNQQRPPGRCARDKGAIHASLL